ncbi:unnamed protein product [Cyprideis torosa]|uniref:Uncharacterized protein n=1 Tax=Cyprideis torosa TaxID=163714 RepID=A0A7R8ZI44_9CRUS|nr:unnamed protein product [Cyprideis torosa]CAG0885247.1 unnamed protein product [Cyprideis torosa]
MTVTRESSLRTNPWMIWYKPEVLVDDVPLPDDIASLEVDDDSDDEDNEEIEVSVDSLRDVRYVLPPVGSNEPIQIGPQFSNVIMEAWTLLQKELSPDVDVVDRHHVSDHGLEVQRSAENVTIEEDLEYLKCLDPRAWKDQDHYRVLGLQKYRFYASDEDIKRAYRRMVTRHHPDKRQKGAKEAIDTENDYFTCITRAWEQLGDEKRRIAYDSADPEFDDTVPKEATKENFYEVFGPVFERNSRWSEVHPVLLLGDDSTPKEKVLDFYDFWFSFESWREFSYLDEEEKEKGENREERRWIEVQNRKIRKARKVEEMNRIRRLVDNAYACDPRIQRFKEEEKEKKMALKKAREDAKRARIEQEQEERRAREEEERRAREKEEAEERERAEAQKQEKERARRLIKKERKTLRGFCKDRDYFAKSEEERVELMTEVEKICEFYDVEGLTELNQKLASLNLEEESKGRNGFLEIIEKAKQKRHQKDFGGDSFGGGGPDGNGGSGSRRSVGPSSGKDWNEDDLQLLIKAFNLFPPGTSQRWEVMAEFINQHSTRSRSAKEVLAKAKDLQKSDAGAAMLKESANQRAFDKFKENIKKDVRIEEEQTKRFGDAPETPSSSTPTVSATASAPWSAEEQKTLEQALKTYPPSADRWDRIAACLPNRTKKECMKRYKEVAEMVKAKKTAQAAVAGKGSTTTKK